MMKPNCPKCGSLSHDIGMSTRTLMMYRSWTDEQGNFHHDDPYISTEGRTCRKCGHGFQVSFQRGEIIV